MLKPPPCHHGVRERRNSGRNSGGVDAARHRHGGQPAASAAQVFEGLAGRATAHTGAPGAAQLARRRGFTWRSRRSPPRSPDRRRRPRTAARGRRRLRRAATARRRRWPCRARGQARGRPTPGSAAIVRRRMAARRPAARARRGIRRGGHPRASGCIVQRQPGAPVGAVVTKLDRHLVDNRIRMARGQRRRHPGRRDLVPAPRHGQRLCVHGGSRRRVVSQ